ncbi:MAG: right-handed parallel beta-helix repeat-containing protein [Verrucomicrobiota bacterium]|nr:right-handed parallel beta-helix repeat-containing protein [Verrucomicrobiota bacterium]
MTIKSIVCKLSLFFLTTSLAGLRAATLYVSTTGSDSNPGTSSQPFRTITYAYSQAGAGTTIMVAPGTYSDYTSGWGLHLGKSGTASNPIVLESQVRGGAIIDGQNATDRNEAIYLDGSYNVVEGFEIKNGPNGGMAVYGSGNEILDNEIDHNGSPSSTSSNGRDGIYEDQSTSGNIYEGNYIHDNGRTGGSNLDHGLYLCGDNDQVFNNVVIRNDSSGLQIAGYSTVSNMKVYNNVFAWNGSDGIIVWMAMSGVDVKNNVLYHNGNYGIYFYAATGSGVVMDHNLIYGNGSGNYSSFSNGGSTVSYTLGTTVSSDPLLANETSSGFDAHLNSGSPAIGAGYNFYSLFTTDLAGAPRPSSGVWDLGAYVYSSSGSTGSGGSSDTTPPTVSMTAPGNGATVSGTAVGVSANASDNVGVASVQFKLDGANLGSALTATPYALTWDSTAVADGTHQLTAVATDTSGNQTAAAALTVNVSNVVSSLGLLTFPSTSGAISAPFYVTNNDAIVQPAYTGVSAGGQAVYTFNISAAGSYVVSALVNAPGTDNNSFFVNVDAQPTDPTMIWDIPVTSGLVSETVSWRGNGGLDTNSPSGFDAQYSPIVFNLTAGTHQLIIRGREGLTQLGAITIVPYGQNQITPPTVSITAPTNGATVSGGISILASASSSVGIAGVQFQLDGANLGPVFTNSPYGGDWNSTSVANGAHTFTAVATDTAGQQMTSAPITVLVSNTVAATLPTVTVAATAPNASRVGPTNGVFTLTRTGDTSSSLTVNFTLGGTAVNGTDYSPLGSSATIPAGAASTTVTIAPLPSTNYVGSETAVLGLSAASGYTVGSAGNATVTIAGNSVPSKIGKAPGGHLKITWSSVVGKVYVVAYKISLSDATWTNLSGPITATSTTTSYTDTMASFKSQGYYVVYVTD